MGWKNLSSWLKGGIILTFLGFANLLIYSVSMFFGAGEGGSPNFVDYTFGIVSGIIFSIFNFLLYPLFRIIEQFSVSMNDYLFFILIVIYIFLLGAAIGYLIGKAKSKYLKNKKT